MAFTHFYSIFHNLGYQSLKLHAFKTTLSYPCTTYEETVTVI